MYGSLYAFSSQKSLRSSIDAVGNARNTGFHLLEQANFHRGLQCDKLNFIILSRLRRLLFPLRLGRNEDGSAATLQCLSILITLPRLLIALATINATSWMDFFLKKEEDGGGGNEKKN